MKRLPYHIILISILIGILVSACGPETLAPDGAPQDTGLSGQAAAAPTPAPATVSPLAGPTEVANQTIEIVTARTPAPTPDLTASTETELDQVTLSESTALQLPETLGQAPLGLITWSPDSKRFLANAYSDESIQVGQAGYSVSDLYLGDTATNQVTYIAANAGWPAWSRDGQTIYSLAIRSSDPEVQYDLYKRSVADGTSQLVIENVGDTGTQPAVSELADGRLLLLNRDYQTALLDQGTLVPVASLANLPTPSSTGDNFSLAPDGTTLAIMGQGHPIYLVDLAKMSLVATIDAEVPVFNNVAWSGDSSRLAYGTSDGIFIYDLASKSQQALAERSTFGFSPDDPMVGFHTPVWSPDERLLLFAATAEDWMRKGLYGVETAFEFAARVDGAQRKAISDTTFVAAPDKLRAIEFRENPETGRMSPGLVNLTWPQR